ncbi:hypothetical protein Dsin_005430 [Dipteronia sinensis]|uniref:BED-type domain-containing protein n=1 Tax=Dipteronia sinensis TaxID=43782 RepID=A0AAE0AWJ9_9ROSI|nr:hypothetical protein Dsin_005430 [Dipteronia sinensis]
MPDLGHDVDRADGLDDPNPSLDFDFDPRIEEKLPKQVKSDLFIQHMKKVTQEDGNTIVICNYCKKVFKWHKSGGYGTYRKHITNAHPDAQAKSSSQAQIFRVKKLLYELYDEYLRVYGPSLNIDVPQTQNVSRSSSSSGFISLGYNLLSKKTKKLRGSSSSSSTTYSELESYLSTSFEFIEDTEVKQFDILHWWNEHESFYSGGGTTVQHRWEYFRPNTFPYESEITSDASLCRRLDEGTISTIRNRSGGIVRFL